MFSSACIRNEIGSSFGSMADETLNELPRRTQVLILIEVVGRIAISLALFTFLYSIIPLRDDLIRPGLIVIAMLVVFIVMLLLALRRIQNAKLPQVRAVQLIFISIGFYLFTFAAVYLSMSATSPNSFNVPLDHTNAFYFTVTVFATVGFGDIVAQTSGAQALVTFQMLLNLLFVYAGLRIIMNVGKKQSQRVRAERERAAQANDTTESGEAVEANASEAPPKAAGAQ